MASVVQEMTKALIELQQARNDQSIAGIKAKGAMATARQSIPRAQAEEKLQLQTLQQKAAAAKAKGQEQAGQGGVSIEDAFKQVEAQPTGGVTGRDIIDLVKTGGDILGSIGGGGPQPAQQTSRAPGSGNIDPNRVAASGQAAQGPPPPTDPNFRVNTTQQQRFGSGSPAGLLLQLVSDAAGKGTRDITTRTDIRFERSQQITANAARLRTNTGADFATSRQLAAAMFDGNDAEVVRLSKGLRNISVELTDAQISSEEDLAERRRAETAKLRKQTTGVGLDNREKKLRLDALDAQLKSVPLDVQLGIPASPAMGGGRGGLILATTPAEGGAYGRVPATAFLNLMDGVLDEQGKLLSAKSLEAGQLVSLAARSGVMLGFNAQSKEEAGEFDLPLIGLGADFGVSQMTFEEGANLLQVWISGRDTDSGSAPRVQAERARDALLSTNIFVMSGGRLQTQNSADPQHVNARAGRAFENYLKLQREAGPDVQIGDHGGQTWRQSIQQERTRRTPSPQRNSPVPSTPQAQSFIPPLPAPLASPTIPPLPPPNSRVGIDRFTNPRPSTSIVRRR